MNLYGLTAVVPFLEFKLRLSAVFLALPLNVLTNDLLIDPHCGDKMINRSNTRRAPIHLVEKGKALPPGPPRIALDDIHRSTHRHLRRNRHQNVHMIFICLSCKDLDVGIVVGYFENLRL